MTQVTQSTKRNTICRRTQLPPKTVKNISKNPENKNKNKHKKKENMVVEVNNSFHNGCNTSLKTKVKHLKKGEKKKGY
jgi:hypothetical protein